MNDFQVSHQLLEFRGIAKIALYALECGRSEVHDIIVKKHQDLAISELKRFLRKTEENYEDMGG